MHKPRKILVPVDFSEHSADALEYALDLAERFDAKLTVLHVWTMPRVGPELGLSAIGDTISFTEMQQYLVDQTRQFALERAKGHATSLKIAAMEGLPAYAILDAAAEGAFDLIVMGSHGRTGLKRFFMGSVAERVARHAPCAVLTVRPRATRPPVSTLEVTS